MEASAITPIRLAIVGLGKIARDQHVPALRGNPDFDLVAVASPHQQLEGVANFASLGELLASTVKVAAVSICTTPQVRYDIAREALEHGCAVMLEKPPGATLSEVAALVEMATHRQLALYATWHSREGAAVEPARRLVAQRRVRRVSIHWKEDVRVWHPGQTWIWQPGGLGVFDPGINALSIVTLILPGTLVLKDAELSVPANCATPIAARLRLETGDIQVDMALDFLHGGAPMWNIDIETDGGPIALSRGGAVLHVDGKLAVEAIDCEYPNLYAQFAALVRKRRIDVDIAPMRLVADAILCGRQTPVAPFIE
jgi:D-galactose 1-dehydrogenase